MGKQINFFLVGKDEDEFLDYIYSSGDNIVDRKGKSLTKDEALKEKFYHLYIKSPQSIIKTRDSGMLENDVSDVIEFSRNTIIGNRVEQGRLYIQMINYDTNGNKIRRQKWLENIYNKYKKWIIKHCKISKDKGWYIGIETYRLYKEEGYKMTDHFKEKPELEFSIEF